MHKKGLMFALGAYIFWGLFPLYWKMLKQVNAIQLIGHRITWSFIVLMIIIIISRQYKTFRTAALNKQVLLIYTVAAVLIAINWTVYVWAVNSDYVIETSLGYFINPLLSVLLGVVFLRERLRIFQWVSVGFATLGVVYLTIVYGRLPWIALALAFSFGTYGLIKKLAPLGSLYGLTIETGVLFIPALIYLGIANANGQGAFLHGSMLANILLIGAGIVTTIPLLLFASAAKSIPLSMMGILQYINPTIQLVLGILLYKEPFDQNHLLGFAIIWLALILFVVEGFWVRHTISSEPIPEMGEG